MVLHFVLSSVLCFWLVTSLNIVFTVFLNFNSYLIFLYVLTIAQFELNTTQYFRARFYYIL